MKQDGCVVPNVVSVAYRIANGGDPPDWLAPALERVSPFVQSEAKITPSLYREYKNRLRRMKKAIDTLLELFPLIERLPDGLLPPILTGFEENLPVLRQWLDELIRRPGGRRPHLGRELCADLICFYWKRVNGKIEPRSDRVYDACELYWQVCGNDPSGDIENWRRMVSRTPLKGPIHS
jgi:hypothetical protein